MCARWRQRRSPTQKTRKRRTASYEVRAHSVLVAQLLVPLSAADASSMQRPCSELQWWPSGTTTQLCGVPAPPPALARRDRAGQGDGAEDPQSLGGDGGGQLAGRAAQDAYQPLDPHAGHGLAAGWAGHWSAPRFASSAVQLPAPAFATRVDGRSAVRAGASWGAFTTARYTASGGDFFGKIAVEYLAYALGLYFGVGAPRPTLGCVGCQRRGRRR